MSRSKKRSYKYCIVPCCTSTTISTPKKVFFSVPLQIDIREKWCKVMKRDMIGPRSVKYVCSDHFDLENDTENLVKYRLVGGILKLKRNVYPHKFNCQKEKQPQRVIGAYKKRRRAEIISNILKNEISPNSICNSFEIIECDSVASDEDLNIPQNPLPEDYTVEFNARGLVPPVFTPLNDDNTVNYAAITAYAKFLAKNGIKSVLVGGTTGEHMSLSVSDRRKIVDKWVTVGKSHGFHIMVQVGGAPLADVLNLANYCSKAGVDSLLTLPELYFKPQSVSELVSYVELVAKAAPNLPVLYYHIPGMSKVEVNMPAFVKEATHCISNFKGIKFTSNDLSEAAQVRRALKEDQEMFLGADTLLAPAALLGITSAIGTTFNLFPNLAQDILVAVEQDDVLQARALQEKLSLAVEAHTVEGAWVPIMKAGMEIVTGIKMGPPALPQMPISEEAKKRIETKLRALKLIN